MLEVTDNIWNYHDKGWYIIATTNGTVDRYGHCVMGAGIAKEVKQKFPELPKKLGVRLASFGNIPQVFAEERIITMPVKRNWSETAKPELIFDSAAIIASMLDLMPLARVASVRPGVGNGKLDWLSDVRPFLSCLWDDRFTIVEKP